MGRPARLLMLLAGLATSVAAAPPPEDLLRAAVIGGVLRYTVWEDGVPEPPVICTVGQPPSEQPLLNAAGRVMIGTNAAIIESVGFVADVKDRRCGVIVVGSPPEHLLPALAHYLRQHEILVICDGCSGGALPVNISLFRKDERIAFEVTLRPQGRIRFRADLLELAAKVHRPSAEVPYE